MRKSWIDLLGDNTAKAYDAVCALIGHADQTVPFLKERLQPPAKLDPKKVAQLLAELGGDKFAIRQKATQELEALGDAAEPALQELLARKDLSLELRQRGQQLLKKSQERGMHGERLRVWRAIEVLEHIGTAQVRPVLERLAGGAPDDKLTRGARESLERLKRRFP